MKDMFISLQTRMYFAQYSFILLNRSSGQSDGQKTLLVCVKIIKKNILNMLVKNIFVSYFAIAMIYKLLTVSEINICCFILGFGLEVSNKGIHTLKKEKVEKSQLSLTYQCNAMQIQ